MKKHTKVYMQGMGYSVGDWIPCEWCGTTAVDTHHIEGRGSGGTKREETVENLVALCRECHLKAEARKIPREDLRTRHLNNLASL